MTILRSPRYTLPPRYNAHPRPIGREFHPLPLHLTRYYPKRDPLCTNPPPSPSSSLSSLTFRTRHVHPLCNPPNRNTRLFRYSRSTQLQVPRHFVAPYIYICLSSNSFPALLLTLFSFYYFFTTLRAIFSFLLFLFLFLSSCNTDQCFRVIEISSFYRECYFS